MNIWVVSHNFQSVLASDMLCKFLANALSGGIYMRPGRSQTGMSTFVSAWDRPDNELRPVWLRLGCWTEMRNSLTGLSSYQPHENDNKSQTGTRNFKPVCFLVSPYIFQTRHIISSRNQVVAKISWRYKFIPIWVSGSGLMYIQIFSLYFLATEILALLFVLFSC